MRVGGRQPESERGGRLGEPALVRTSQGARKRNGLRLEVRHREKQGLIAPMAEEARWRLIELVRGYDSPTASGGAPIAISAQVIRRRWCDTPSTAQLSRRAWCAGVGPEFDMILAGLIDQILIKAVKGHGVRKQPKTKFVEKRKKVAA